MFLVESFFILWLIRIVRTEEVFLDIAQGQLKGLKLVSIKNERPYNSFKGIPYAEPRFGVNKFQSPEPAGPWEGVLDATNHRPKCAHWNFWRKDVVGGDDCLYLNVYTPELDKDAGKPVIVYIHAGFFNEGSGNDDIWTPDYMIERDFILVTFNYRLGAAGFLSTNDANAPGNNGLKDQIVALKWIQSNIRDFGGDPNSVTLLSESGIYHLISPMSKGLFKNVVMVSGGLYKTWAVTYEPREVAFTLGKALGIETDDTAELMDKLKNTDINDIVKATQVLLYKGNILSGGLNVFSASVEPNVGQEIFLPDDPMTLLKYGELVDVPVMMGTARDDGSFLVPDVLEKKCYTNDQFDLYIPNFLNITDPVLRKEIGESIKKRYFNDKPGDSEECLTRVLTDVGFFAGSTITAKILGARLKSPVYEYFFNYDSYLGVYKAALNIYRGVMYYDFYFYLFYIGAFKLIPAPGSVEEKVLNRGMKMFFNFALEGNPTATKDEEVNQEWLPVIGDKNCMDINSELTMQEYVKRDEMMFWAEMYKDVLGDFYKLFI